ncbi:hypothetical protein ASE80_16030 [Pseudomonas sp. Leaf15]|uniref:HNH endonuclease n=1 Tax=unclassified Pseudomonas TaxID=196821 RepID=UPI00070268E6|nr:MULTISPECIES: hypothetical protein [unclassified Pseudomonas]KQM46991.1 hypothetical protein ASE80_16030 [Pseudomonas sp. Leaf15]RAH02593.1 hypothetical protein DJ480_12730 [Pseudomonas sp. Leaf98]
MFETISPDDLDEALLKAVRRHQGKAWSSNADVVSFRTRLLELQNFRCAYCQGLIDLDEVGHRELDHIFPKSATENCSEVKGQSNEFEERQHTFGYPQFTYEPLNIIVACKICNSYKKNFDPLLNRTVQLVGDDYPAANSILWFYPYVHHYSQHIERSDNWTYTQLSTQGEVVIKVCKLDQASVLASRFSARALIRAKQSENLRSAAMVMAADINDGLISRNHAIDALVLALEVNQEVAVEIVQLWLDYVTGGSVDAIAKFEELLMSVVGEESFDIDRAQASIENSLEAL